MNIAIIAAAGSGTRLDANIPKQFIEISGKPLVVHTLDRFDTCPAVDEIFLVLPAEQSDEWSAVIRSFEIKKLREIVTGGSTRAESVRKGLEALDARDEDIIIVHDGARPLVSISEITKTIETAQQTGAACLVAKINDTVKEIDGDTITATIDRTKLRRALTPQAFRYHILEKAFGHGDLGEEVTDESYLVERMGYDVEIVEGNARNIKITHPEDVAIAELYLSNE